MRTPLRLLSVDDVRFLAHLGGWAAVAAAVVALSRPVDAYGVGVERYQPVPVARERVRIAVPVALPAPSPAPTEAVAPGGRPEPRPVRSGVADAPDDAADSPAVLAARLLGTRGDGRTALVAGLWSEDEQVPATSDALSDAAAADPGAPSGARRPVDHDGPSKGGAIARIGRDGGTGTLEEVLGTGPTPRKPTYTVGTDAAARVRPPLGPLQFCYERRLMQVPSLEGRIEIAIGGGQAPRIAADTIGDEELARCVLRAASRWQTSGFGDGDNTVPIVFRPGTP